MQQLVEPFHPDSCLVKKMDPAYTHSLCNSDMLGSGSFTSVFLQWHQNSFKDVGISPILCWLFMIFLAMDTFTSLSVLNERIDNAQTAVKINRKSYFPNGLPADWTSYSGMRGSWCRVHFSSKDYNLWFFLLLLVSVTANRRFRFDWWSVFGIWHVWLIDSQWY